MYTIYNIVDNTNNNIYVGKTNNMKQRMIGHLSNMKSEKIYCSSEIVLKNNNYTVKIIENNLSDEDAIIKEKYYIQNTPNCINALKYDFDIKEYKKEYNKEYYQKNKEKIAYKKKAKYSKEKNKEIYQKKIIKSVLDDIITQIELEY